MKKILSLSIVSFFLLSATCKKDTPDSGGNGPDVTLPTSGYLCTNGKTYIGNVVNFYFGTTGWNVTSYVKDNLQADMVSFVNNSNNTISIKRDKVYVNSFGKEFQWFGIELNYIPSFSSFPNNAYLWNIHETKSDSAQFVITRKDDDKLKFTIESKKYPGYYLAVGRSKSSVQNVDDNLTYGTVKVWWWFEK